MQFPCTRLVIMEWRCCWGLSSCWGQGPLAGGGCLLTCLLFTVQSLDLTSIHCWVYLGVIVTWDIETWAESGD